ncbi:alpha-L-rhamnosidase [Mariniphaga anaerophila]|uniref:alpha-L-rhamnosidase n=1 Tax=Mariniphaga anaerophila TaxID=1484053 RepID=A0A1M5G9Z3_9BACT|nr:alpha-L-rhamnosidase [Mariniphaga anaerophila]SHG00553.1 alpha-L-rhamnosidase [Mariniphaga anaerophila]
MNRYSLFLFFLVFLFVSGCGSKSNLSLYNLKCEGLTNPLGIDKTTPRFSWKISSTENGTVQKAFQILVASELSELTEKQADFWNSGKIESGSSLFVSYGGKRLSPGVAAFWKVRVWDEQGNVSPWSEPAKFGIGLLTPDDWQAQYIAFNTENGYRECPLLHKDFDVAKANSRFILHVNSLGYHEVYVNGKKAGSGVLAPAVSQFGKRSLINTYDVTGLLKDGKNHLMLWLGSGWYTDGLPGVANNGPVVRAQLEKVKSGRREVVVGTDSSWQGRISSYTRHGDWRPDRFGGEIVDGLLVQNNPGIDVPTDGWQPVSQINIPAHEATPQMTEKNTIRDTIKPAQITQLAADTFLVDMGTNLTGWLEMRFPPLEKSQTVKMEYCDHLVDGKFNDRNQYDEYIASAEGQEVFVNKFNYHGFRYVRVTGLKQMPDAESVRAYLVHTDYELASGFECSDSDLNQIHDMLFYTLRCLSLGGDLVDCPQIERLGYGGDGNASTVTAQTMLNLGPLYNNWLQAWADAMREDGGMPHTAPNPYRAGGGPYWCGFIITASWNTYLNYGDTLLLKKYYPVMQKWLGYVENYSVDGLLKRWPDTDYRGWYLGDWATPEGIEQTAEASVDVVNNSFVAVCFDNMERIANVLEKPEDAEMYRAMKEQLQQKIHEVYFNEDNNTYGTGTQIDLAYPMIAGVVPSGKADEVERALLYETDVNRNGHFACGLVGLPVITEWAVKSESPDFMYSMLKKRDYPGFLYMLDNGATTTWEHWNGARSRIHNCYNGIGSWFYQGIGGIRSAENVPAYRKVVIQPQIPNGITWANTFQETPFGTLSVNWKNENGILEMNLKIPVGMEADVVVPDGVDKCMLNGAEKQLHHGERAVALKSGMYQLSYKN